IQTRFVTSHGAPTTGRLSASSPHEPPTQNPTSRPRSRSRSFFRVFRVFRGNFGLRNSEFGLLSAFGDSNFGFPLTPAPQASPPPPPTHSTAVQPVCALPPGTGGTAPP